MLVPSGTGVYSGSTADHTPSPADHLQGPGFCVAQPPPAVFRRSRK
jgi:hypothetical protein